MNQQPALVMDGSEHLRVTGAEGEQDAEQIESGVISAA